MKGLKELLKQFFTLSGYFLALRQAGASKERAGLDAIVPHGRSLEEVQKSLRCLFEVFRSGES